MGVSTARQARSVLADAGAGDGGTSPSRGQELFSFVAEHRPRECLELGFRQGVATLYIAAALEANALGRLTSVDLPSARDHAPTATEVVELAGLTHRVELTIEDDGYTWFLHRSLLQQVRGDRIEPVYDFVFLDGAHTWDIDGLAVCVLSRLIVPGGWLLIDDLDWVPGDPAVTNVPASTRTFPHLQHVWDLLIRTDPSFDRLTTDGQWGWAQKSLTPQPQMRTVVDRNVVGQARELARLARSAIRR